MLWIRICFNTDPDPAFNLDADPEPVFNLDADPNPVFNLDAAPDPAFNRNAAPDPESQTNANPCGYGPGSWSDFCVTKVKFFNENTLHVVVNS